jgi:hypothetical protein
MSNQLSTNFILFENIGQQQPDSPYVDANKAGIYFAGGQLMSRIGTNAPTQIGGGSSLAPFIVTDVATGSITIASQPDTNFGAGPVNIVAANNSTTGGSILIKSGDSASGLGNNNPGNIVIQAGAAGFSGSGQISFVMGTAEGAPGWTMVSDGSFIPNVDDISTVGAQGGAKPKYGYFSGFMLVGRGNDNIGSDDQRLMAIGSDNDLGSSVTKMTIVHMSQTDVNGGGFNVYRLRGTDMGSPTPVLAGDVLGTFSASGNIGNPGYNIKAGAGIRIVASQNWSSGHCGSEMIFSINLDDSMDSPFDVYKLRKTGDLELLNGAFLLANGGYHIEPYEVDAGNSGAAVTLDLFQASSLKLTLDASTTVTLTNPVSGGKYLIRLIQDATGSRTVTWPAEVKWPNGTPPTLSTAAGKIDIIKLYFDGTNYYGESSIGY